ncbi:MAG: hypothetical protein HQ549_05115 [Candidatus Omnitrophica bacterium]|nr:hypothetical protein [Candidatus Omnitrophota bacterium]
MNKVLIVLATLAIIPLIVSCAAPHEAVKGTGEGLTDVATGAVKGTVELGKGTAGFVSGGLKASGEALQGKGDAASRSGKVAVDEAGEGLKGIIEEPMKGVAAGIEHFGEGVKKSTEEVK